MRRAVERLYTHRCNVYEKRVSVKDGRSVFEKALVYSSVPCRLSVKAYLFGDKAAQKKENYTKFSKRAKLFLPCECVIKEGSLVEVEVGGETCLYGRSGAVSFYASHNEVTVEMVKDYA